MGAALLRQVVPQRDTEPEQLTLLELVDAVSDVTDNDDEVVATVISMLQSGTVALTGNFRSEPIESFCKRVK